MEAKFKKWVGGFVPKQKNGVKGTDNIDFIPRSDIPQVRDIKYTNFFCNYRPLKSGPYWIRLVVGGEKLTHEKYYGVTVASLLETKLLINSVIYDSKQVTIFWGYDLKDSFLASPMDGPEYMIIPWKYIPDNIWTRYNLETIVSDSGYLYVNIKNIIYGLEQVPVLSYYNLVDNLSSSGYSPIPTTIGMWKRDTKMTDFLCVDYLGIKYFSEGDAHHLLTLLQKYYALTVDMEGNHFCVLIFDWNYDTGYVDIKMSNCVSD